MIIAVDTSIVTYALEAALLTKDDTKVNYICQRIQEAVPQMQRTLCIWLIQDLEKYAENNDADYLKAAPLGRLLESLKSHFKEFK